VDFRLLQLNLATLQRQELLDPLNYVLNQRHTKLLKQLVRMPAAALRAAPAQLRRELQLRVPQRGLFGALLEPLLTGRNAAGGRRPLRPTARRSQRRRCQPQGRRLLGFDDFLAETLGVTGPGLNRRAELGRAPVAHPSTAVSSTGPSLGLPRSAVTAAGEELQRRREDLGLLATQQPLPLQRRSGAPVASRLQPTALRQQQQQQQRQQLQQLLLNGYDRPQRLRQGGGLRGSGSRQITLRGRREGLLRSYLTVETDLHPFRGWPVDYHREQCWDFWKLDRSLLPAATLERLQLQLEELPETLRRYLLGRADIFSDEQMDEWRQLRGDQERRDFEKKLVAELKKLCPPVLSEDRLEAEPIWQPGLEWWKPRHLAAASVFAGRPRRRCTQGTNRAARAPARLYQRVFLPRLMGALEGDHKIIRQLMPFTLQHPYSYRWRRLNRRYRRVGVSQERFMRWGPNYGKRVNRAMTMGRPLNRLLRRRLQQRPPRGQSDLQG
jgi:hypothetical protein